MTATAPARDRLLPPWGGPLTEDDYAALAASWITREIADEAMLRRVDANEGREIVGQKGSRDCAGILFTNYWPGQPGPVNYRIRRDTPDWVLGKDGEAKPQAKYLGAPKSWNRLYIPPGVTRAQLADLKIPIIIVEGEKKALAVWRLANHETDYPLFIPIAIAGVWAWRGIVAKIGGPNGQRVDVKGVISDFDRIQWTGRRVRILFDSNVLTNESVKWARTGIARELATRKSEVDFINLPADCPVNGIDDLLALWGPERVLQLFAQSAPVARLQIVQPPNFQTRPDGMYRIATKGEQLTEIKLTNYQAAIVANILLDDGVSTAREFEIKGEIMGGHFTFTVPAQEFARMDWPIDKIGPAAITYPNQREYARTAIQSFSMAAEERRIYAHTGWCKIDDLSVYLHAGGGIGNTGAVPDVGIRLSGPMNSFDLESTELRNSLIASVQASLRLCDVGPAPICFPILAATYRAVLGDTDFSLHLAGPTGTFKTELATLHQQHFGAKFDSRHLPGSWSSTANSLESLAFQAKDTLLVIDDFAPQGSAADVQRYHAAADRVFRAAGNRTGRGRMDSTTRLREPKPPRCLILSTGEEIPRGQSIRARLLILELSQGEVNLAKLTACQKDAMEGQYVDGMIGFVQWIAGRYEELQLALIRRADELRVKSLESAAHARTPGIVANLQAGFELYLDFAEACGALRSEESLNLAARCWEALGTAAAQQGKHQAATDPVGRYLSLLRALLSSGRAHLAGRGGGPPDRVPEACGWRSNSVDKWEPLGDCIGWVDGEDLYLEPTAAYTRIQVAGRDRGEGLEVSEQTMSKRLNERKLLVTVDVRRETLTVRKTICRCLKSVLHLSRSAVLPESADDDEEN